MKYTKGEAVSISKHFLSTEMDCKCKRADCTVTVIDPELIEKLQRLRSSLGRPIIINSGYRCEAHNKAIGGSPTSQHLLGKAADIRLREPLARVKDMLMKEVEKLFTGIGIYSTFIHVDIRNKKARWFG